MLGVHSYPQKILHGKERIGKGRVKEEKREV